MLSISLSLVAVFLPMLLMGGIVGRLFREFALTLSMAVLISLVISLTTTPMMCSRLLRRSARPMQRLVLPASPSAVFDAMLRFYRRTLALALRHSAARRAACWSR